MKLSGKEINDNLDEHKSQFKTDADTYKEMFEDVARRINCNKNPAVRCVFWQKLWLFSKNFTYMRARMPRPLRSGRNARPSF